MGTISLAEARRLGLLSAGQAKPKRVRKKPRKPQPLTGPPQTWTITIPDYLPPSLNELMHCHWRTKHKLKKECLEFVAHYGRHVLPAVGKRRVLLTYLRTVCHKEMDPDNAKKAILDALVKAGILGNDTEEWVECPDPVQSRSSRNETTIVIEELP